MEELDNGVDRLVLSATRKHPDNRYACMADFLSDLEAILHGEAALGTSLRVSPDAYRPTTDRGQQVFDALSEEV